jgi:serine protease
MAGYHRWLVPLAVGLLSGACASSGNGPEKAKQGSGPEWSSPDDVIDGEIVVDFKDGTTQAEYTEAEKDWGVDVEFNSVEGDVDGITVSRGAVPSDPSALADLLARIRKNPKVVAAEPLMRFHADMTPNDPMFEKQWNLRMINAPAAWEKADGSGVVVAVIDTGIAYEDRGEFKTVPDLRDAKFAKGYNFVDKNDHPNDDHGHGTHVAGTIAQVTNNGEGCAGIAYKATLMPLKVLNASGMGTSADIADAIRWAADHGANVINMSLGGGGRSEVMAKAIEYAHKKGVTIVAAAGNGGRPVVEFPAAYENVIAVSAVGPDGKLAPYSSYGKELDIAAPGGNKSMGEESGILQNTIDPSDPSKSVYAYFQGTSMATPHVAGVAALVISTGVKDPDEVEKVLTSSATAVGDKGWDQKYGHGILNAEAAVGGAKGGPFDLLASVIKFIIAVILGLLVRRSLVATGIPRFRLTPGFWVMALLGAAGFFFLRWLNLGGVPVAGPVSAAISLPIPDWERWIFGPGKANPLFYSALIPIALSIVGSRIRSLRSVLAGLCIGFAAFLGYAAFTGAPAIAWMPFRFLAMPWLVVNALIALILSRGLLKKE